MQEVLMTPEVCMQFLIWSYYYHNIIPEPKVSYHSYARFSDKDATRLDEWKDTLFKCFEEDSVIRACKQFQQARFKGEPCPYPQSRLDAMFATEDIRKN